MIKIGLRLENMYLGVSDFLELDSYAPDTTRRFTFYNVQLEIGTELYFHQMMMNVTVEYYVRDGEWREYTSFDIRIFTADILEDRRLVVVGLTSQGEYEFEYRQGMMDVFKIWSEKGHFDWFSLSIGNRLKKDYIWACSFYSGLNSALEETDTYKIDMELVQEELDFFYLAGLAFLGDRGCVGSTAYTFEDCLLSFFHENKSFAVGKRVIFLNVQKVQDSLRFFLEEIKTLLMKFKFEVIESNDYQ